MATEIIMPKAGMAMEEGTIIKWLVTEGSPVKQGEPLLEILTDKVNMEVEAQVSGSLLKILRQEGEVVPVTQVIGYIGAKGEKVPEEFISVSAGVIKDPAGTTSGKEIALAEADYTRIGEKVAATPAAKRLASEKGLDLFLIKPTGIRGEIKARDVLEHKTVAISPLAMRVAEDNGIDLTTVKGSGYRGKIVMQDIASRLSIGNEIKSNGSKRIEVPDKKPLAGVRKLIAERMTNSHLEIPPVTLNTKADVTELAAIREQFNKKNDEKLSLNDFILKASALALREHPILNSSLINDEIIFHEAVNVGMAVALEDGLMVPVIRNADLLTIREISMLSKQLSGKARKGAITLDELTGGTFSVSNLGMYDILSFNPIINKPEAGILGACAIEEEIKLREGNITIRKMMGLSLTIDHRIVDGAVGAVFLRRIKQLLESPLELLL